MSTWPGSDVRTLRSFGRSAAAVRRTARPERIAADSPTLGDKEGIGGGRQWAATRRLTANLPLDAARDLDEAAAAAGFPVALVGPGRPHASPGVTARVGVRPGKAASATVPPAHGSGEPPGASPVRSAAR
jgi:hypothetical protein